MSEAEIVEFATSYDPQVYHVDAVAARDTAFEGLVASGWHTAAVWMRLYVGTALACVEAHGSPGVDELRWLEPVRPGDTLAGTAETVGKMPSLTEPRIITVKEKGILTRSDGVPVLSLVLFSRIFRKPPREEST
ncbi:MaoC/PaaZ C-terminal domain-containing protein [Amycolatopsis nigrescens]|uniref:MaoC/PaaZ C-terminal domain-containing protein n=1 Tax=Amycolatopsis nigrescens TaxID=381445 RepID=UPI00037A5D49|nr:MaoC/PaaZ C-terminal domain-containing protein [Amycolatopsis nigrescens]